jgi:hypothetical protein
MRITVKGVPFTFENYPWTQTFYFGFLKKIRYTYIILLYKDKYEYDDSVEGEKESVVDHSTFNA